MENNTQSKQKTATAKYDVPYHVHGTDASALGGTSPEMTKLTELTMRSNHY